MRFIPPSKSQTRIVRDAPELDDTFVRFEQEQNDKKQDQEVCNYHSIVYRILESTPHSKETLSSRTI